MRYDAGIAMHVIVPAFTAAMHLSSTPRKLRKFSPEGSFFCIIEDACGHRGTFPSICVHGALTRTVMASAKSTATQ